MKPTWFDFLLYRIAAWRWNRILASRPDFRELAICYLKAFDVLDNGDNVLITVTITKETDDDSDNQAAS